MLENILWGIAEFVFSSTVIRLIKPRRIRAVGHVARMGLKGG
jgi:hypothetical protein